MLGIIELFSMERENCFRAVAGPEARQQEVKAGPCQELASSGSSLYSESLSLIPGPFFPVTNFDNMAHQLVLVRSPPFYLVRN